MIQIDNIIKGCLATGESPESIKAEWLQMSTELLDGGQISQEDFDFQVKDFNLTVDKLQKEIEDKSKEILH